MMGLLLLSLLSACTAPPPDDAPPTSTDAGGTGSVPDPPPGTSDAAGNESPSLELVGLTIRFTGLYPTVMTYEPSDLEVDPGTRVRVTFHNDDKNPLGKHNWRIKDLGNETREVPVGESDTLEFDAPAPGAYLYICSVPRHETLGMKGNFIVNE